MYLFGTMQKPKRFLQHNIAKNELNHFLVN